MRENRHIIREYEALRAVLTTGTTIGAARRLGISQPAISRALTQLENRLGRTLFLRISGRIEPTAEALSLNETLDPLFETLSKIDGAEWAHTENKPLSIAASTTIAHCFLLPRLATFLKQDSSRRIQFETQPTEQIVAGVLEFRYDLGLTSAMIQQSGVKLIPWRKSKMVCVMPEGHCLANRDTITPQDLDGVSTVDFVRRLGGRSLTEQIFNRSGVRPNIIVEAATNIAAVELARAGIGVTVLNPFPQLTEPQRGLVILPFESDIEYRTSFVLSADRPPSTQTRNFMRHIKFTTPEDQFSEAI